MKKLLDGLVLALGTVCLFGLPSAALAISAWLGDHAMKILHPGSSVTLSLMVQIEAVVLMFGTAAGGLLLAISAFAALWWVMNALNRAATGMTPEIVPSQARRLEQEAPSIGTMRRGPSRSGSR